MNTFKELFEDENLSTTQKVNFQVVDDDGNGSKDKDFEINNKKDFEKAWKEFEKIKAKYEKTLEYGEAHIVVTWDGGSSETGITSNNDEKLMNKWVEKLS